MSGLLSKSISMQGLNVISIEVNQRLADPAKNGDLEQVKKAIEDGADGAFDILRAMAEKELDKRLDNTFLEDRIGSYYRMIDVPVIDEPAISRCRESCNLFIKYTLFNNPETEKPDYISDYPFLGRWNECQSEVRQKIGNSNISVYQFLSETDENKLAGYLSNQNTGVRKVLESDEYKDRYPLYASMIENQYNKVIRREELVPQAIITMKHSDLGVLPNELINKVTSFLSNPDLERVRQAGVLALNN